MYLPVDSVSIRSGRKALVVDAGGTGKVVEVGTDVAADGKVLDVVLAVVCAVVEVDAVVGVVVDVVVVVVVVVVEVVSGAFCIVAGGLVVTGAGGLDVAALAIVVAGLFWGVSDVQPHIARMSARHSIRTATFLIFIFWLLLIRFS